MFDNVVGCRPIDMIYVDPAPLKEMVRARGLPRTEFITSTAMEEIAERLSTAEAAWEAGEFARLSKICRSIIGLSEEIGLESLAQVAGCIAGDVGRNDTNALAALVARLVRVGEASLSALWDLGHLRL
ncbi:MAG: hypothetical protein OXQ92_06250 [Boseongicola sp.]|nr:hypothetical protein [Boseongicola sp.]MDD9979517.1 hypothetical protein [Boseongicola sp.]